MADIEQLLAKAWDNAQRSRDYHHREALQFAEEMAKIAKAALAVGLVLKEDCEDKEDQAEVEPESEAEGRPAQTQPNMTMKDAAAKVLETEGRPMTTNEILGRLNGMLGTQYPRSSLSPQLSRLKTEGRIHRVDGLWVYSHQLSIDEKFNSMADDARQAPDVSEDKEDPTADEAVGSNGSSFKRRF